MLLYTCFNDREYNVEFLVKMTECAIFTNDTNNVIVQLMINYNIDRPFLTIVDTNIL